MYRRDNNLFICMYNCKVKFILYCTHITTYKARNVENWPMTLVFFLFTDLYHNYTHTYPHQNNIIYKL